MFGHLASPPQKKHHHHLLRAHEDVPVGSVAAGCPISSSPLENKSLYIPEGVRSVWRERNGRSAGSGTRRRHAGTGDHQNGLGAKPVKGPDSSCLGPVQSIPHGGTGCPRLTDPLRVRLSCPGSLRLWNNSSGSWGSIQSTAIGRCTLSQWCKTTPRDKAAVERATTIWPQTCHMYVDRLMGPLTRPDSSTSEEWEMVGVHSLCVRRSLERGTEVSGWGYEKLADMYCGPLSSPYTRSPLPVQHHSSVHVWPITKYHCGFSQCAKVLTRF